ncbi:MAG: alanine racemase [Anaerolineaceae bacterium]
MNDINNISWVEIDLSAVQHNTKYYLETVGVPLMAVVKANAFGCGAIEVGKSALAAGASWLAVARYCEAHALREANITAPILVFGAVTPEEVDQAIHENVTLSIYDFEVARLYAQRAQNYRSKISVHIKVDTGLGRLGVIYQDAQSLAKFAVEQKGIAIDGVYSHFAMADVTLNNPMSYLQLRRFNDVLQALQEIGISPKWIHCSNSGAAAYIPEARFNLVRVGAGLIAIKPVDWGTFPPELQRVISWKTRLVSSKVIPAGWSIGYGQNYHLQKDEIIGVLAIGYADGFHNMPDNEVLIHGKRIPVIGNVCCDMCMVKLPDLYPNGTEVVLLGNQEDEWITIEDLALRWKLSDGDITSLISPRNHRLYIN